MLARDGWRRGGVTLDGLVAVGTWLVATPIAVLLVHQLDLDPFTVAGVVMPIAVGAVGAAVVLALLLRRQSDLLIGVATGGYAAWIGLTLATACTARRSATARWSATRPAGGAGDEVACSTW